jgi:hypothetical protein
MNMRIDNRERDTILAALRCWQVTKRRTPDLIEIATDDGKHEPLGNGEIDQLCERLNIDHGGAK